MNTRLILYTNDGQRFSEKLFENIESAVAAGYRSRKDFLVCEIEGQPVKSYWTGRRSDTSHPQFRDWPFHAHQKDIQAGFSLPPLSPDPLECQAIKDSGISTCHCLIRDCDFV